MTKFLFYEDWWKVVKELPSELRLQVYDALTSYAFEGKQPTSEMVNYITALMRTTIERDSAKWQEISTKRRDAINKRWGKNTDDTNVFKSIQTEQMNTSDYININSNMNMNRNITMNRDSNESNKEKNILKKESGFIPPTVEEVSAYCKERDNGIDAEAFVAYYESIGWTVGKSQSPMKNWKSAVVTWERNPKFNAKPTNLGEGEYINDKGQRTYAGGYIIVPMDAPPRPSKLYKWDKNNNRWVDNPY